MVICRLAPTSCTVLSCESRACGAGVTGCPALSVRMASLRSTHEVTTEVDRYISWPGQALAYKLGEMTMRRVRSKLSLVFRLKRRRSAEKLMTAPAA